MRKSIFGSPKSSRVSPVIERRGHISTPYTIFMNEYGSVPTREIWHSITQDKDKIKQLQAMANKENRIRWRQELASDIADICVSMHPLQIPPYLTLEIVNQLPNSEHMTYFEKMKIIDGVRRSCQRLAK